MIQADNRWAQMYGNAFAKEISNQKTQEVTRNNVRRTIEHSSTQPYIFRDTPEGLAAVGIEVLSEDAYTACKWSPADIWLNPKSPKYKITNRQKKQLKFYGWWDNETDQVADIWYKTNNQGFRDKHFGDLEPGIACFGCSHTYGSGVHSHQNWPSQLAELTGEKTFNLGTPACSLQLGVWYALNFIDRDIPNLTGIAVFVPPMGRAPVATKKPDQDFYHVSNLRVELLENVNPELELDTATLDKYVNMIGASAQMSYDMHLKTLQLLARQRGIPIAIIHSQDITPSDWARDLIHFGPDTHSSIARMAMQKLGRF